MLVRKKASAVAMMSEDRTQYPHEPQQLGTLGPRGERLPAGIRSALWTLLTSTITLLHVPELTEMKEAFTSASSQERQCNTARFSSHARVPESSDSYAQCLRSCAHVLHMSMNMDALCMYAPSYVRPKLRCHLCINKLIPMLAVSPCRDLNSDSKLSSKYIYCIVTLVSPALISLCLNKSSLASN